ncbi:hypothetical protein CL620_03660 [archaeon]|nr:hypothetical protein [archaeon]|tara:strand:- start:98 stop:841 length:744 start_codon:yes stop_codon:yes gene_type:complete
MVLGWFFRDEFGEFYNRVERLQKFLVIVDEELLLNHFKEVRAHFRCMRRILPRLTQLYKDEQEKIRTLPASEYKKKLTKFAADLELKLNEFTSWINNAVAAVEKILKNRVLTNIEEDKIRLKKIINHITSVLIKAQRDAFALVKLEKRAVKSTAKNQRKPVSRIPVVGKLYNGWRLRDIQSVIIDLGGVVEPNDGAHPYKIRFPHHRSIPLATSTPPFMLVREVSAATSVDNKVLIASFSQGELLAA